MFFNLSYNMTTMLLVKHGSATFFSIVNGARLPVTTWLFSLQLVMGSEATPMHWNDWYQMVPN